MVRQDDLEFLTPSDVKSIIKDDKPAQRRLEAYIKTRVAISQQHIAAETRQQLKALR